MNILPGEPPPPGFEDEVNRVAEIQPAIDQYKGNALVGLEYALELHEEDRHEPGYFCVLCDKRGDPRTIMQHWTSFNHRLKYLEKHYPTAMRQCNPIKYRPNSSHLMILVVQNLAEAIEDHHGRQKPTVYNMDDFRRMKTKIINDINASFHYDEGNGPNFLNVADRTLHDTKAPASASAKKLDQTLQITIKAPKRLLESTKTGSGGATNRDLDEISSDSDSTQDINKKSKRREQSPAYRIVPRVHRSPPFDNEPEMESKKLPTPKELSLQASHIAQERYKWEKYRCMLEIQKKQMEKLQQDYEKSPEKHPLYPEEWKKFWNRRYQELQAEKKVDPNKYDYKPEWIVFWTKRMKEMLATEFDKKRKEIKVKLGLSEDAEEMVDSLKEKYKVQISRTISSNILAANANAGGSSTASGNPKSDISSSNADGGKVRNRDLSKIPADVIDISDDDDLSASPPTRHMRSSSHSRKSRSISPHSRHDSTKRTRRNSNSRSMSPLSDDYDLYTYPSSHHHHHAHHAPRHRTVNRVYPPPSNDGVDYYNMSYTRTRPHRSGSGIASGHYMSSLGNAHTGSSTSPYRILDSHKYPKYERSPTPNSKASASINKEKSEPPEDDGPLTVVAVLRLLTALEDHLGSLGPKVVDLLGKALALEKVKANSADELLLNEDHCVFFETIKEKLKGLLIADVLDDQQKIRAVKKAIKNIATVVHQVTTKAATDDAAKDGASTDTHDGADKATLFAKKNNLKSQKPSVKDLPFDRHVVATKLAAALVIQGREDVSTEDMDKLIFMFVLMVKLSKERSALDEQPLSTKDLLPELGISLPVTMPLSGISKTAALALASLPPIVDQLLENKMNAIVQEAEEEISNDTSDKDSKNEAGNNNTLESLTDSDLQTLLQNFKHLSTEEQHHLIAHLKKLETADPARVEKLRKFVNVSDITDTNTATDSKVTSGNSAGGAVSAASTSSSAIGTNNSNRTGTPIETSMAGTHSRRFEDSPANRGNKARSLSNYSDDDGERRRGGMNVSNPNKFSLDDEDEDDDYNFDEVFKAASSNVNRNIEHATASSSKPHSSEEQEKRTIEPIVPVASSPNALTFNPAGLKISLSDTQNIIANLMGSLQQSNASTGHSASNSPAASSTATPAATAVGMSKTNTMAMTAPQPVPPITGHAQSAQTNANSSSVSMSYYNQQQQQQFGGNAAAAASYNNQYGGMPAYYGGYGNMAGPVAGGYGSYGQPWLNGQQMQSQQQQYGMQNFIAPQQQQTQHQHRQQQMGYNMYGGRSNN